MRTTLANLQIAVSMLAPSEPPKVEVAALKTATLIYA
jgi:hypothetical protein